ncbi:MAG: c-type cytochrome biogenesis protein CcmI [Maricaulaceae bacterium]
MVLFFALMAITLIVLWPFLRPTSDGVQTDWTRQSLKAALAAVDKDEARGVLSAEAAEAQRVDIARKAEAALTRSDADRSPMAARPKGRAAFICVSIILVIAPVLLWAGYARLGTPNPQRAEAAAQEKVQLGAQAQADLTLESAIAEIETRLKDTPEEGRLWVALGDLKNRQADYAGAEAAFEQAVLYSKEQSEGMAQLWLILAMTRRSQGLPFSDPSIVEPLERSLALDPNSPAAILLARVQDKTP